jgi:hypothetical protein
MNLLAASQAQTTAPTATPADLAPPATDPPPDPTPAPAATAAAAEPAIALGDAPLPNHPEPSRVSCAPPTLGGPSSPSVPLGHRDDQSMSAHVSW